MANLEEIFADHTSHKGSVSGIYKEFKNSIVRQIFQLENGQRHEQTSYQRKYAHEKMFSTISH